MNKIVTISIERKGWSKGNLLKCVKETNSDLLKVGTYELGAADNLGKYAENEYWQPQQLLVLSEELPKEGDLCISFKEGDEFEEIFVWENDIVWENDYKLSLIHI